MNAVKQISTNVGTNLCVRPMANTTTFGRPMANTTMFGRSMMVETQCVASNVGTRRAVSADKNMRHCEAQSAEAIQKRQTKQSYRLLRYAENDAHLPLSPSKGGNVPPLPLQRRGIATLKMAIALFFMPFAANAQNFGGGSGSSTSPYQIASPEHLAQLAGYVNAGDTNFNGKHYILTADIDLAQYDSNNTVFNNGKGWIPIGNTDNNHSFKGNFNGNGKKITHLYINDNTRDYCGVFGRVTGGKIENLGVENVTISGRNFVGGVAGIIRDNSSSMTNCYSIGKVSGNDNVGGVAGSVQYNGSVSNCYSTGAVSGNIQVGGVAGYVYSNCTVSNCYAIGAVSGRDYVGGVAGYVNGSTVSNCYSTGAVSGNNQVGGVAGYVNTSTVSNCYATGAVSGNNQVGGVAGYIYSYGSVTKCAALNPSVKATNTSGTTYVGRVVGQKYNATSILSGNIAFSRLLNNAGTTSWTYKHTDSINGADITAQSIAANGSLNSVFIPSDTTWTVINGYLPGLFGNVVEVPWHLRFNAPAAVIITQPQDAAVSTNAVHALSVTATVTEGGLSYRWYSNSTAANTGGTAISGATASTYQPPTDVEGVFYYYVEIVNYMPDNGNGGNLMASTTSRAATFTVQEGVGIAVGTRHALSLQVYPNPVSYELQVTSYELQENSVVEIYDVVGQCVGTYPCGRPAKTGAGASPARTIDVSHLANGMYFLKVGNKVVRFVKE